VGYLDLSAYLEHSPPGEECVHERQSQLLLVGFVDRCLRPVLHFFLGLSFNASEVITTLPRTIVS
jgi:hypothetical protein